MARSNKPHADSVQAAVAAAGAAKAGVLAPPACVTISKEELPFWRAVVLSKSLDEWSESDLVIAGQLARSMAGVERMARSEHRDTPAGAKVADTYLSQVIRLVRLLKLQSVYDIRDVQRQRRLEQDARLARQEVEAEDDDGLLA